MIKYGDLFVERQDGKYQIWWMERRGNSIRSNSGIYDKDRMQIVLSSLVTSTWKDIDATNVGRSNERNPEQQAEFSINREYRIRKECGYVENIGDQPHFIDKIEPMLANKFVDNKNYCPIHTQPKLDGLRCIATQIGLYSRNWKPIVSVPHIYEQMKPLLEMGYVFDGELYNHDFRDNFNKIISLARKTKPTPEDLEESSKFIQYWIYDIIEPDLNFSERSVLLKELLERFDLPNVVFVPTLYVENQEELDAVYNQYLESGFEGQMLRTDTVYENRRTNALLKRKTFQDEEFKIRSIEEGTGNWSGYAKRVMCYDPTNDLEFTATLKNDQTWCKKVLEERDDYIGGDVTVRFQNRTPDNIPRFPIAVMIYKGGRDE